MCLHNSRCLPYRLGFISKNAKRSLNCEVFAFPEVDLRLIIEFNSVKEFYMYKIYGLKLLFFGFLLAHLNIKREKSPVPSIHQVFQKLIMSRILSPGGL